MKIELPITTAYLPDWGVWEGLREIFQNAKDAQVEHKGELDVDYVGDNIVVTNTGVVLSHEALLFGHTSKVDRDDLIGKFGEGLKLGLLALTRAGKNIKIKSGDEEWRTTIEPSENFDAEVLCVFITKGNPYQKRVSVEISATPEEWFDAQRKILFLQDITSDNRISTPSGDLLLGEIFQGSVFVKGIFVEQDSELNYGYNYKDAEVDRDRKMVKAFDKQWNNSNIWKYAVAQRPDLFEKFFALVSEEEEDVAGFDDYKASGLPKSVVNQFAEKFEEQFGEGAVPVANIEQSRDIEHLGKRGVVVNAGVRAIVERNTGSADTVVYNLRQEVTHRYSWHDLNETEQANLTDAVELVNVALDKPIALGSIDIADFRSDTLLGQYKDSKYILAKSRMEDRDQVLLTLVHEIAHNHGGDGDKGHVAAIERIWSRIVSSLRAGV